MAVLVGTNGDPKLHFAAAFCNSHELAPNHGSFSVPFLAHDLAMVFPKSDAARADEFRSPQRCTPLDLVTMRQVEQKPSASVACQTLGMG